MTTYKKILILFVSLSFIIPMSSAVGTIPDTTETYPSWSPDGQRILFISYGPMSQGIFIVNPDGKELQKITSDGWNPSWNPDGTNIVIQKIFYDDTDKGNGSYEFALLNIMTLNITRLTYGGSSEAESRPKFSPDGKKITLRRSEGIYIMNSNGTNLQKIVENASSPEWSPNGEKIAYYTYGDQIEILIINSDGTDKKRIFIDYDRSIYSKFRWTSDSKYLLLNNGSNIITKVNIGNIVDIKYLYNPVAHLNPKYSPDGNFVAFVSNMDGGRHDLFVARSNGSDLYRLVFDTNPELKNATADYFYKKNRPTPPPWPTPSPTPEPTVIQTTASIPDATGTTPAPEVQGFSFLAGIVSLTLLVLLRRIKK